MSISGIGQFGSTVFQMEGDILKELTRCACSFCTNRGALLAYYRPNSTR